MASCIEFIRKWRNLLTIDENLPLGYLWYTINFSWFWQGATFGTLSLTLSCASSKWRYWKFSNVSFSNFPIQRIPVLVKNSGGIYRRCYFCLIRTPKVTKKRLSEHFCHRWWPKGAIALQGATVTYCNLSAPSCFFVCLPFPARRPAALPAIIPAAIQSEIGKKIWFPFGFFLVEEIWPRKYSQGPSLIVSWKYNLIAIIANYHHGPSSSSSSP